ncbi:MAG: hypothetical protein JXA46_19535 [Dehalococcoidales bacterium]|nr:hypothetical protein [Dehalococcoidales bacterium]
MNIDIEKKIRESLVNGKLPCPMAFRIAGEFKITPKEIGEACNRMDIKVSSCQLGCFH